MTEQSKNIFTQKLEQARNEIQKVNGVLNGNPNVNDINTNKEHALEIKEELDQAISNLTPDKQPLVNAKIN